MVPRVVYCSGPLGWLFGSARQTNEAVEKHQAARRKVALPGSARPSIGFIEDTSCYHKATCRR